MKDMVKLMIATKILEMFGIICAGMADQYGVDINLKTKIDMEVNPKKGRTTKNGSDKKIY